MSGYEVLGLVTLVKHQTAFKVLATPLHYLIQPSLALGTAGQTRVCTEKHSISQSDFLFVQCESLVAHNVDCPDVRQVAACVEVQVGVGGQPDVPAPLVQPVLVDDAYN